MDYIYVDNFRGFSDTIVPLESVNFFVGENSTGKSSILALVYLLANHRFWLSLNFDVAECCDLGGFKDIISVGAQNKKQFTIGLLQTQKTEKVKKNTCSFMLMSFKNDDGFPKLYRYIQFFDSTFAMFVYQPNKTKFKTKEILLHEGKDEDYINFMKQILNEESASRKGLRGLPDEIPNDAPPALLLSLLESTDRKRKEKVFRFSWGIPFRSQLTWLAPIRTKPKRTYGGFKINFSPEGDHTPYVLRKIMDSKEKGAKFIKLLSRFGDNSGLFKSVNPHSFGKDPSAPFEVQIKLSDQPINISNVGYGVSQVLPLIVEMLTRPKGHWFAIQQPEVHIHPKAQAALGDLIHFLALEEKHKYFIETHSDYLIDRFRLRIKRSKGMPNSQVLFFEREIKRNKIQPIKIDPKGRFSEKQPKNFRDFFINEELKLLEI